ncbi:MAG: hypothetical protein QOF67_300 [Mycobacterium sp.]|nr:hypothetical protein [Mycobacterium sp.]
MFRRSNAEHRKEDAAFVGVGRVCGDYPPGLAGGVVGERFYVAELGGVRFRGHMTTVGDRAVREVGAARYGLELTVERGTGWGPRSADSSDRPMHWPEL